MSTILKALKKLEEEQRAAAPVSLADKVLTVAGHERRAAHKLPWVAAGVLGGLLAAGVAVVGIYWLTATPPAVVAPGAAGLPQATAVNLPAPPVAKAPAPPAPAPSVVKDRVVADSKPASPPSPPPVAGNRARSQQADGLPVQVTAPMAPHPVRPAAPLSQSVVAGSAAATAIPAVSPPARAEPARPGPQGVEQVVVTPGQIPPAGQQWTASHLEVSDILGSGGSGGLMAVVNGLPVMEGTRVDNALVKEIRADQVIFEIEGRNVVVPKRGAR